jgi:histidine triad (HIT) family protein
MLDCIFCRIANHEISSTIVYEDEQIIAFEDIDPQAPVHVLIVPKKHITTLSDLKENETEFLQQILMTARTVSTIKNIEHSGFRIVLNCNPDGGQTVYHLHAHLLGGRKMNWPPG